MKKIDFNADWKFVKGYVPSLKVLQMYGKQAEDICLPHDAMIYEERIEDTKNAGATGFYPGGTYTYFKSFEAKNEWKDKSWLLEFEGVYEHAMVYLNGALVCTNKNGYTNFYADLTRYLHWNEENELKVVADNSSEENSRWYSGSGIYRNVNLYIGNMISIPVEGVKITTQNADEEVAVLGIRTKVRNESNSQEKLEIITTFCDDEGNVYAEQSYLSAFAHTEYEMYQSISIPSPKRWSPDSPFLYHCSIEIRKEETVLDSWSTEYGIRTVSLDAIRGLCINGKEIKLRGTCIHHDHGILGASSYKDAEMRKCMLLKEAGFNSVRCAHNPASRAFLEACDKTGLLVMDELTDMWTVHKNCHDFAFSFSDDWEMMVERMVAKDYNHPCVIMYSIGNEIQEVGSARGAEISRLLSNKCRQLDPYRYTTSGVNALNAAGAKIYPIMQDLSKMIKKDTGSTETNDNSGSNAINSFMQLMEGEVGDAFATHPMITEILEESSGSVDIIGLNYLTGRHLLETELHPNKCVLGTETFPADIVRLWSTVKASKQVLGDFTWTGLDYLGEAGCGIFYYDGNSNFGSHFPDRTAYIGDMDIIGYRRPMSYLREVVYGLRKEPYIAVDRMDKNGKKHSKTPWMYRDNVASWTWYGYEHENAHVEVYSASDEVELFLNGVSQGRKAAGEKNSYTVVYTVPYEAGELKAIGYSAGVMDGSVILRTAQKETYLNMKADRNEMDADGKQLCFVMINLCDKENTIDLWNQKKVHISLQGDAKILAFGSANPQSMDTYHSDCCETYDGHLMAVIQAGKTSDDICVSAWMEEQENDISQIVIRQSAI